ncbi:hypothetical protein BVRB_5g117880 [Beta vulgaris subsp. vulgaris]|nr:hypothetical protein BVRB_5g117880 [Beta vulgaris subsp. vulgaris]
MKRDIDWSELCRKKILPNIAGRLKISRDFHSFGAVCKKWHSSLSSIKQSKTLHIIFSRYPVTSFRESTNSTFRLSGNAIYLLRPLNSQESSNSKLFLITVEEFYQGKLRLFHPLTRNRTPIKQNGYLNMSDFHVSLITNGFILTRTDHNSGSTSYYKALTSAYLDEYNKKHSFFIDFNRNTGRVSLEVSLRQRQPLVCENVFEFDDIVFSKRLFYTVDSIGRVYVFRTRNSKHTRNENETNNSSHVLFGECIVKIPILSACNNRWRTRLVVDHLSDNTLYLVQRDINLGESLIFLKVYKLNEERCKWDEVNSIGDDRVLFISVDWCFFASTADFPGYRGNCVFLLKDAFPVRTGFTYSDESFFEGASKELEIVVYHLEDRQFRLISGYPGYSDILWPPPAWFCDNPPQLQVQKKIG